MKKFLKVAAWSVAVLVAGFIGLVIEEIIQHPDISKHVQPVQTVQPVQKPAPTPVVTTPTSAPTPTPAPLAPVVSTPAPLKPVVDDTAKKLAEKLAAEIAANRQDLSSRKQDVLAKINSGKTSEAYNDLYDHESKCRSLAGSIGDPKARIGKNPAIPSNLPANVQDALENGYNALYEAYTWELGGFGNMMSSLEVRHVGNYDQANMDEANYSFNKADKLFDQALQYFNQSKGG